MDCIVTEMSTCCLLQNLWETNWCASCWELLSTGCSKWCMVSLQLFISLHIILGMLFTAWVDSWQAELVHVQLCFALNMDCLSKDHRAVCLLTDGCGGRKRPGLPSLWPFMTSVALCSSAGGRGVYTSSVCMCDGVSFFNRWLRMAFEKRWI